MASEVAPIMAAAAANTTTAPKPRRRRCGICLTAILLLPRWLAPSLSRPLSNYDMFLKMEEDEKHTISGGGGGKEGKITRTGAPFSPSHGGGEAYMDW